MSRLTLLDIRATKPFPRRARTGAAYRRGKQVL
jgi:hypothetical protein